MSQLAVEDAQPRTATELSPETVEVEANRTGGPLETWLHNHLSLMALAAIFAGFALRVFVATRTYLNPDEAWHYFIVNQPSAWLSYKASLLNAHPPLVFVVLYIWRFVGRSPLMLRFPSLVAGTAFCWFSFKWIGTVFGKAAGFIGLILCAFSSATVSLSTQVRGYALLLFCVAGALYFLSLAFQEQSVGRMWCFSLFLYLAILSHYSALFVAVALGLYALARFADSWPRRGLIVAWACGQAGALAIYVFLYLTHVSKIRDSITVWGAGFEPAYFQPASTDIVTFTGQSTLLIFTYLFGQRYLAGVFLLLFAIGSLFLFVRDMLTSAGRLPSARSGILLLVPFIAVWAAAIAQIYPYVGTRHTVFLAPFAIAGVSYLLAAISKQRLWVGLLLAAALLTIAFLSPKRLAPGVSHGDDSPAAMASAMNYMKQSIPQGDHILVDFQSYLPFAYYFCGPNVIISVDIYSGEYLHSTCNGNPIISLRAWQLRAAYLTGAFERMARSQSLHPGNRVWVYQTGWGGLFDKDLSEQNPSFRCLASKRFGDGIVVAAFIVGPDLTPTLPAGACSSPAG